MPKMASKPVYKSTIKKKNTKYNKNSIKTNASPAAAATSYPSNNITPDISRGKLFTGAAHHGSR